MAMPFMRLGLIVGTIAFAYVTWASSRVGFPIEIALVRGMLGFMGISFVAYLAELVVATSPSESVADEAEDAEDEDADASDDGDDEAEDDDDADAAPPSSLVLMPSRTGNEELEAA